MSAPRGALVAAVLMGLVTSACAGGTAPQAGGVSPALSTPASTDASGAGPAGGDPGFSSAGAGWAQASPGSTTAPAGRTSPATDPKAGSIATPAPASRATTSTAGPAARSGRGGGRQLQVGANLTPTSPSKRPAGSPKPTVTARAAITADTLDMRLIAEQPLTYSTVVLHFSAASMLPAGKSAAACVLDGAEYICTLGDLGRPAELELVAVKGAKGSTIYVIEATTDDQTVYRGSFELPVPEGS